MHAFTAEVRPVRWLEPAAGIGFGLGLLALAVADVPSGVRAALLVTFAVAAAGMRRELRRAAAVRSVAWDGEHRWTWNGTAVTLAPSTRVHPGLVVLVVAAPSRAVHWIPRAAMLPDAFRRLKTALRHGSSVPASGPVPDASSRGASPARPSGPRRPPDTPC